jgi:iron(III) transport system ATP-binding protein
VTERACRRAESLYALRLARGTLVLCLVSSHHQHAIDDGLGIRLEARQLVIFPRMETDLGTDGSDGASEFNAWGQK